MDIPPLPPDFTERLIAFLDGTPYADCYVTDSDGTFPMGVVPVDVAWMAIRGAGGAGRCLACYSTSEPLWVWEPSEVWNAGAMPSAEACLVCPTTELVLDCGASRTAEQETAS